MAARISQGRGWFKLAVDYSLRCRYIVSMAFLRFDWDSDKANVNLKKHGIAFEEATSIFYDELAVEFYDDEHDEWEDRFLLLGVSLKLRLLLVCHCYREDGAVIRIISARKASEAEATFYRR